MLIHRAWHTGEAIEAIANLLREKGHTDYCPTVAGNHVAQDFRRMGQKESVASLIAFLNAHQPLGIYQRIRSAGR